METGKIILLIQARCNSMRLNNKVLTYIYNYPILGYLLERLLLKYDRNKIIIATSNQQTDDKILQYCIKQRFRCYRGDLVNVSKRLLAAAQFEGAEAFVRINGDSPLIDPKIIVKGIEFFNSGKYDLVTNTSPRSFPVGQSVEIIKTSTFKKAYKQMLTTDHFEHVTKYYYEYPEEFRIKNFSNNRDLSKYRLVVDTPEDLERIKTIIGNMTKPHTKYTMDELIELYPSA